MPQLDAYDIRSAVAPKADAMKNMLLHTIVSPMMAVKLFGSISGLLGSGRLGAYSAANAALTAYAIFMQSWVSIKFRYYTHIHHICMSHI